MLKNIRTAIILIDSSEQSWTECKKAVGKFLEKNNIEGSFYYLEMEKINEGAINTEESHTLHNNEIARLLYRFSNKVRTFRREETDLIINLIDKEHSFVEYLIRKANAKIKVGRVAHHEVYNFVIENPKGEKYNQLDCFNHFLAYQQKFV